MQECPSKLLCLSVLSSASAWREEALEFLVQEWQRDVPGDAWAGLVECVRPSHRQ